ncbi:MAG: methyltransferase domain-containing protein [Asticcacaulis sp.]|uniref:methyltransferase domain-containing protein n=1 Tax=Asticcacaulis sp. TaxID=1872648 RepID=UPI003F7C7271
MRQLVAHSGRFGKIRIYERLEDGARYFMTGASVQTLIDADGVSLFGYINACKILLRPFRKILMLGGGGGSLASMLARKGHVVTVVDIDPVAEEVARAYFGLDKRVRWLTDDARTFPFTVRARYDAVMVDACTDLGTDSRFFNPYWLARAMTACRPKGVLLLNLALEAAKIGYGRTIAEAVSRLGFHAELLQPDDGWEGNEILQISRRARPALIGPSDIHSRPAESRTYLMSLRRMSLQPSSP